MNDIENLARLLHESWQRGSHSSPSKWEDMLATSRDGWLAVAADVKKAHTSPIPMLLGCPWCGERHIDEGEFATKPHHTHACQNCGMVWRPALVPTVGVRFLPGFRNEK